MGALLGDNIDQGFMRDVFDHEVELKWHGQGNRAVELLGNILGGTDPDRLMQVLNSDDDEGGIYVDDTTIVLCPLTWALYKRVTSLTWECGNFGYWGGLPQRTSYMEALLFNVGFYSTPLSFNKLNWHTSESFRSIMVFWRQS
jgi:hypothetical protein